ncbi:MAG: EAL and GGDEF domain-containing protein [Proteobacteria bacterium]|nr:EAL and GGDEF domain-containing protein [Pseudomonadota bacterium]MBU1648551.1 EAL and GGDEF domain-containing protein [Pseudomonadota bacterium]MBU1986682.1 EAL and GGDEF domain-containing protein [Pseudomonadota bacterium]
MFLESTIFEKNVQTTVSRELLLYLLDTNNLTSWFQPIFSRQNGEIYGYEALARVRDGVIPPFDISKLFLKAQAEGIIASLDMQCRENAFCRAAELGFVQKNAYLYVNICPGTLIHSDHRGGVTDRLAEDCGIPKDRIVLEITEQEAIKNYDLFQRSIDHYRKRGYKIAIDDFGVGYGGLKMLSIVQPDYVKIDRHFIDELDRFPFKYNLVDAMATVCHKLGIMVIAEGIERQEELDIVSRFGIDLFQGYYLERPGPDLSNASVDIPGKQSDVYECTDSLVSSCVIGSICRYVDPLAPIDSVMAAFKRFHDNNSLQGIAVVAEERVLGMLPRMRFLEQHLIGPHGFGYALCQHRMIKDVLEPDFLLVEASTPVEEVVRLIQGRRGVSLYDDLCVSKNGKYVGTVAISALLDAITKKSIQLAKGASPLTGLPGNEFIQRTVARLIEQRVTFDVCYVDIDDFKPYNDYYGFEKGDMVIKGIAQLLVDVVQPVGHNDQFRFVGHIGGDDFIVISRPHASLSLCEQIINKLQQLLPNFHGEKEFENGCYQAMDRQGQLRCISLLSLSIGIVSTEDCAVSSYAELAYLATGVKRAAKKKPGSAIVSNRRMAAQTELASLAA